MSEEDKVLFKKVKRQNVRQRRTSADEADALKEDEIEIQAKLEKIQETKEKQKLRERPYGVPGYLATGKKNTLEEGITAKDPFNVKNGGMVNMQALKSGKLKAASDDAYDTGIGTQFSAETNIGDTDEEMMKYIEEQLKQRKGLHTDKNDYGESSIYLTPEDAAILSLPKHLRENYSKKSEEMLSNQMLNGIPEVDLGIDAKIKNIEATEEAKQKLINDQKNKKDAPSKFVPQNYAVNFVQHNRCNDKFISTSTLFKISYYLSVNIDATNEKKRANQSGDHQHSSKVPKKATDDYHFDKFKKQFRRH